MLLTRKNGNGATSVDELKKQASAAAVAKAVEVIKNGGTQAEAAAAAKGVARDILARGQQQLQQKPQKTKKEKKGLMGKLRKNKKEKKEKKPTGRASSSNSRPNSASARQLQRGLSVSPDPESTTTDSRTDSRSESSGDASSFSSSSGRITEEDETSNGGASKASNDSSKSSKPTLSLEESVLTEEDMSLMTDDKSRSTIHVTDLLNMGGVMNAIDKALEEQDIEAEIKGKKHWMDRILDCEMCFGTENENFSIGSSASGDGRSILSKDAPSVLSGNGGGGTSASNGGLEPVDEEKSFDTGADTETEGEII